MITTPLKAGHEQNQAENGEESADVVDFSDDFGPGLAFGVGSGWREVKHGRDDEGQPVPDADDDTAISPAGVG